MNPDPATKSNPRRIRRNVTEILCKGTVAVGSLLKKNDEIFIVGYSDDNYLLISLVTGYGESFSAIGILRDYIRDMGMSLFSDTVTLTPQ